MTPARDAARRWTAGPLKAMPADPRRKPDTGAWVLMGGAPEYSWPRVAYVHTGKADAQLLAQAFNSHAALVEALEAARAYMVNAAIDLETRVPHRTTLNTLRGGISQIDAALAASAGRRG